MIYLLNARHEENALYIGFFYGNCTKFLLTRLLRFGKFLNVSYIAHEVNNKAHVSTELRALQADIQGGDCSAQQPKRALHSKPGSAGLLFLLAMQFGQLQSKTLRPILLESSAFISIARSTFVSSVSQ